jgi:heterodisulfide reductase subunit C
MTEKIDFAARKEFIKLLEGHDVTKCFQCGTCTACCVVARFAGNYNPRMIILKALRGSTDVFDDERLWLCGSCHKCSERCPEKVDPAEVLRKIREEALRRGTIPQAICSKVELILKTGFSLEGSGSDILRKRVGLQPLSVIDTGEISKIARLAGLNLPLREEKK